MNSIKIALILADNRHTLHIVLQNTARSETLFAEEAVTYQRNFRMFEWWFCEPHGENDRLSFGKIQSKTRFDLHSRYGSLAPVFSLTYLADRPKKFVSCCDRCNKFFHRSLSLLPNLVEAVLRMFSSLAWRFSHPLQPYSLLASMFNLLWSHYSGFSIIFEFVNFAAMSVH